MPEEFKEIAAMLHNTCQTETGVAESNYYFMVVFLFNLIKFVMRFKGTIEEARKGNFMEDGAFKCYLKCLGIQLATVS